MTTHTHNAIYSLVNKEFLIRVKIDGISKTHLVSAGAYHRVLGSLELALKHFEKAFKKGTDKVKIRLRRGITITFISR